MVGDRVCSLRELGGCRLIVSRLIAEVQDWRRLIFLERRNDARNKTVWSYTLNLRSTGIPWVCKQTSIFQADVYPTTVFWDWLHGYRYPLVWGINTHKQQYYRNVLGEKQGQEKRFDQKYFLSTVSGVEVGKKKCFRGISSGMLRVSWLHRIYHPCPLTLSSQSP